MKKVIFTFGLIATMAAGPAFAQEGDWTGAYIGAHAGYGTGGSDSDVALSNSWTSESQALQDFVSGNWSDNRKPEGFNFGAQIGYNYQTGGNFVISAEAEFSILNADDGRETAPLSPPTIPALSYRFGNDVDAKHMFALKAKAGVAMDKTLIYATGGWAWTKAEFGAEVVSNGAYSKEGRIKDTLNGFIVGAGVEHKFSDSVSARLDYAYTDQGSKSYATAYRAGSTFAPPAFNYTENVRQDLDMHLIRLGINFHF